MESRRKCTKRQQRRARRARKRRRSCKKARLRRADNYRGAFAPTSFWNKPLAADADLDPRSDALVGSLLSVVNGEVRRRNGPWINTGEFSTPVYEVPGDQATVSVKLDHPPDAALQTAFRAVPIPAGAQAAGGTDKHMVVWQPAKDKMWEFWKMTLQRDGWHARWGGAMHDVSSNRGYFNTESWPGGKPWWGATATSLPLLGGLMRIREAREGRIDHALAIAMPNVRQSVYSWPAQRTDGNVTSQDAIPEGARFRLDPKLDLARLNLPPLVRTMAAAAQRYGIVVRDYAGVVTFYGEDPAPFPPPAWGPLYGGKYPSQLLASFPWQHLKLVKMDLRRRP
jgi:hypothetical protein